MTDARASLSRDSVPDPRSFDSVPDPRARPFPYVLAALAILGGLVVWLVSVRLFPYHSVNHDEGVYLQQAAMLLDGELWLTPPVPDAVRPWFFVDDGGRLYSKYTPVAAATFAPGLALGVPRLVLALIAAGNVALVGLLGREAFDARTGAVAAALVLTAPLFVLSSSVFLSYAPATFFNLLFAFAYVRAHRRESRRGAVLAGVAVGLAFFARPFTAVLFASPFVVHALFALGRDWLDRRLVTATTIRLGIVAALGSAFVAFALAYNWVVTGDPLTFPSAAFAPEDGPGFGHRQILDHERDYTPELAIEANRRVLRRLFLDWGPLGWAGTALAGIGLVVGLAIPAAARLSGGIRVAFDAVPKPDDDSDLAVRALLAGLFPAVVAGNVFFWGNLNALGSLDDPADGLIANLGPFYHFDLLLPLAVFGAAGVVALADLARGTARRIDGDLARRAALAAALVAGLVVAGGAGATAFEEPVERNADHRDAVAPAYEPFEETDLDRALVFVPTPYGPWLQHPFQWLRNDPSFDGDAVYALDRGAEGDFETLDAFDDRRPYRFTYRGDWPPDEDGVDATLRPLTVERGEHLRANTTVGVVAGAQAASVRITADGEAVQYGVEHLADSRERLTWVVGPDEAFVVDDGLSRYGERASVPVDGETTVAFAVTFTQPGGSTITYRQELAVDADGGTVRAVWPPETRVCRLRPDCGREGTYVEGGDYGTGASLSTNLTALAESPNGTAERE